MTTSSPPPVITITLTGQGFQGVPGTPGTAGTAGPAGVSAFTSTTADFSQPAIGSTVNVAVLDSSWIGAGQPLALENGGSYSVSAVPDATHVTIRNVGASGNAAQGTTVSSGSKVSPGGVPGAGGGGGGVIINTNTTLSVPSDAYPTISSALTYLYNATVQNGAQVTIAVTGAISEQVNVAPGVWMPWLTITTVGTVTVNSTGWSTNPLFGFPFMFNGNANSFSISGTWQKTAGGFCGFFGALSGLYFLASATVSGFDTVMMSALGNITVYGGSLTGGGSLYTLYLSAGAEVTCISATIAGGVSASSSNCTLESCAVSGGTCIVAGDGAQVTMVSGSITSSSGLACRGLGGNIRLSGVTMNPSAAGTVVTAESAGSIVSMDNCPTNIPASSSGKFALVSDGGSIVLGGGNTFPGGNNSTGLAFDINSGGVIRVTTGSVTGYYARWTACSKMAVNQPSQNGALYAQETTIQPSEDYTLTQAYIGAYVRTTQAGTMNFEIDAGLLMDNGTETKLVNMGGGDVTLVAGAGVNFAPTATTLAPGKACVFKMLTPDTYDLIGAAA